MIYHPHFKYQAAFVLFPLSLTPSHLYSFYLQASSDHSSAQLLEFFIMDPSKVYFDPPNMYASRPWIRARIIHLVVAKAPDGADSATVV